MYTVKTDNENEAWEIFLSVRNFAKWIGNEFYALCRTTQVKKVASFGGTKVTNPEQNVSQVSSDSGSAPTGMETQGQTPSERDDKNVVQDDQCSETGHQSSDSPMLQDDEDDEVNTQETEKEEIMEEESLENNLVDNTMEQIQVTRVQNTNESFNRRKSN